MELMDETGMMNEKNLEYFKRVVEEMEKKSEMRDEGEYINKGV